MFGLLFIVYSFVQPTVSPSQSNFYINPNSITGQLYNFMLKDLQTKPYYNNCSDLFNHGVKTNGVYLIRNNGYSLYTYCNFSDVADNYNQPLNNCSDYEKVGAIANGDYIVLKDLGNVSYYGLGVCNFSAIKSDIDYNLLNNYIEDSGINLNNINISQTGFSSLPYWFQNDTKQIWIKVPEIDAGSTTKVYVTTQDVYDENGDNVFEFFDDFKDGLSKWNCLNGGGLGSCSLTSVDGKTMLALNAPNINNRTQVNTPFSCKPSSNIGCFINVLTKSGNNIGDGLIFGFSNGTMISALRDEPLNGYGYSFSRELLKNTYIFKTINSKINYLTSNYNFIASNNTYYNLGFLWIGDTLKVYLNNSLINSTTDNYFNSFSHIFMANDYGTWYYDYIFVRKYTSTPPTLTYRQISSDIWEVDIYNPGSSALTDYQVPLNLTELQNVGFSLSDPTNQIGVYG